MYERIQRNIKYPPDYNHFRSCCPHIHLLIQFEKPALVCQSANSYSIKILSVDYIWPMLDIAQCLKNRYTGRIFTLLVSSTVVPFMVTGAMLAARCIRILLVNQHV